MKKNKMTSYLLVVAVAGIWGMIIYKVFAAVNGGEDEIPMISRTLSAKKPMVKVAVVDTGELDLSYPDPFRQTTTSTGGSSDTLRMIKKERMGLPITNKTPTSVPVINWPSIRYSGYIMNPKTRSLLSLVTIGSESAMLSEGQSAGGVKLIKNMKDSVRVRFLGRTRSINLSPSIP